MHCYEMAECPVEIRSKCEAFKTGHTTDLKCREYAPVSTMLEGSTYRSDGSVKDIVIRCHSDCAFYKYYMGIKR
jgi:hypothetical protein